MNHVPPVCLSVCSQEDDITVHANPATRASNVIDDHMKVIAAKINARRKLVVDKAAPVPFVLKPAARPPAAHTAANPETPAADLAPPMVNPDPLVSPRPLVNRGRFIFPDPLLNPDPFSILDPVLNPGPPAVHPGPLEVNPDPPEVDMDPPVIHPRLESEVQCVVRL